MGSRLSRMRAGRADGTDVHNNVLAADREHTTGESTFFCIRTIPCISCTEPSTISAPTEPDAVGDVDVEQISSGGAEDDVNEAGDVVRRLSHVSALIEPVTQHATRVSSVSESQSQETRSCTEEVTAPVVAAPLVHRLNQMSGRGKFVLLVTVCFSLFTAMRLMSSMTQKSSDPPVFFKPLTGIEDFRRGEMTQLSLRVLEHEVAFVVYYAHWDLDSMRYRSTHEEIAKVYGQEIFFAAINCWWPEGECSKVMRLKRFPVLLAHVRNVGDVEYRGPLVTSYIIPFLENILVPVIPVQNPGELLDLRSRHDVRPFLVSITDLITDFIFAGCYHSFLRLS